MVSWEENKTRLREYLRFRIQEISGLIAAVIITAFIFSFRDWGEETFDALIGLQNFLLVIFIVALSLLFRLTCQKWYALSQGYKAEFKVWWIGLVIALVIALVSAGRVPLVLVGGMVVAFMVRQRLGEFRYGFSYWQNAIVALWGILGNLIMAILFAVGLYFSPQSYLFHKGLIFNLMMAFCALWPVPQLDGLQIFFGSRNLYYLGIFTVFLGAALLLSRTMLGLILAIVIGTVAGIIYLVIGSEK